MGNRILKESVCTSPNIDQLSWFEEVCFYRLILQCDDYGRFDARPLLLRSRLFPLKTTVTCEEIADAMDALEAAGLIEQYTVNGSPYLQLPTWGLHQRVRTPKMKFPPPL